MPSPQCFDNLCSTKHAVTYQGPHATPTGHAKVPGKSWLAFSDGPRNCIGMQVGQLGLGTVYNSIFMSTQLANKVSARHRQHSTWLMHYRRHKAMLVCFSACSLPTWTCARLQW
jgi:cytochrome P450